MNDSDYSWQNVATSTLVQEKLHYAELLKQTETKLEVATKIMAELISFKQWVDHVYPDAIAQYDAVMAVGGEVIYNMD